MRSPSCKEAIETASYILCVTRDLFDDYIEDLLKRYPVDILKYLE